MDLKDAVEGEPEPLDELVLPLSSSRRAWRGGLFAFGAGQADCVNGRYHLPYSLSINRTATLIHRPSVWRSNVG